jgi:predicted RNA-binding Zn ribbon-like protein
VSDGADDLERPYWDAARGAARLLTSPLLGRVRACAAADCGWWFLDDTKNASRRWCDMKICGNRDKVRRFRARGRG